MGVSVVHYSTRADEGWFGGAGHAVEPRQGGEFEKALYISLDLMVSL